jgi:hypothetical protein
MECRECQRRDRMFLESLVEADRAETALRCYFITHQKLAGIGDLDEYTSLREQQERLSAVRHLSYLSAMEHRNTHGA